MRKTGACLPSEVSQISLAAYHTYPLLVSYTNQVVFSGGFRLTHKPLSTSCRTVSGTLLASMGSGDSGVEHPQISTSRKSANPTHLRRLVVKQITSIKNGEARR